jgi:hypothetical protein
MRNLTIIPIFLVSFALIALLGEMAFFRYASTMRLAVIGESSLWQQSASQVAETLASYAETADFAKEVSVRYPGVKIASTDGISLGAMRSAWQRQTNISPQGSVLTLRLYGDDAFDAEQVLRATTNTLIAKRSNVIPRGYRLAVLELPYNSSFGIWQWFSYVIIAASITFGIRFVFLRSSRVKPFAAGNRRELSRTDELRRRFEPIWKRSATDEKSEKAEVWKKKSNDDMIRSVEPDQVTHIDQKEGTKEKSTAIAIPRSASPVGFAPANLPIVEEKSIPIEKEDATREERQENSDEPSNEEYKRRLNELLQGKWQ